MKSLSLCICLFTLVALATSASAEQQTFNVESADDFEALIESKKPAPGDTIVWAEGSFADVELDIAGIDGTEDQPIILRSATPGATIITGESQFKVGAKWWVIQGFHFTGDQSKVNSYNTFQFRSNSGTPSQHVRLTDCAFTNLKADDETSKWILLFGQSNVIDHCHFSGKNSKGALITVELGYLGDSDTAGHKITNNYFGEFYRQEGNDNETIRIGSSNDQNKNAKCLVSENYFVRCDGESEIISSKSSYNVFEKNTFRQCGGALVLRHGHHATVNGNFFFGDGAKNAGGIRVVDSHHTITNNFLQGLNGTIWRAAFSILGGSQKSGGSTNGYQAVDEITVMHNSILNCTQSLYLNKKKGSRAPTGIFANNLISNADNALVTTELPTEKMKWVGNLMHGNSVAPEFNAVTADPMMKLTDGLLRPDATGPAADAAIASDTKVTTDIDGQTRPETKTDIGADEVSGATGEISSKPLTPADVGVSFLRGEGSNND